jgi:uncharacterized protein (TIGR03382 family)
VTRAAALGVLLASAPAAAAPVIAEDQQVTAPMRQPDDLFGWAVAVDGDVAVVTAPTRQVGIYTGAGEAFLLRRADEGWTYAQEISEMDAIGYGRELGRAVALRDGTLAVAAPAADLAKGAVYLFVVEAGVATRLRVAVDPEAEIGDRFGAAVAVDGDFVVIGETPDELPADDEVPGRAYVLVRDDGWNGFRTLDPVDGQGGDRFGWAVAVDGDVAVVGAPGKESGRGAAYVFVRDGEAWTRADKLVADERAEGDFFGEAVAVEGDLAVVGAFGRDLRAGAVYLFRRDGDAWPLAQVLTSDAPAEAELFGAEVAVAGGYVLASAWGHEPAGPDEPSRGAAYLFGPAPAGHLLLGLLRADDGVPGDLLGVGAALSGRTVMLGAPYDDAPNGPDDLKKALGAAYLFELAQAEGDPCVADGDCAGGAVCCEQVCAGGCADDPTTSSGGEPGTSTGAGSSEAAPDPTSGGGPPPAVLDPLSEGCGCAGSTAAGAWWLALAWLGRRRRSTIAMARRGGRV